VSGDHLTACPACLGPLRPWRNVVSAEPAYRGHAFALLRCSVCGTAVTIEPAAPELNDSGAFAPGVPRLHRLVRPLLHLFDRRRLALLAPLAPPIPPARLLDAGAGRGRFVASARAAGYTAFGIEPAVRGAQAARELGVEVAQAGIEDALIPAGSLQAVTLWHVLEHLDDPAAALVRIAGWLGPGGALLVGVPNLDSWQARVGGARWYHLDVPRHRVHFTPAGLAALLRRAGFEPVRTSHVLLEHNPFGMWQSALSALTSEPSYLYNLLKRNAPVRARDLALTVAFVPLAPLAALAELVAGLRGRGGTIAVLARAGRATEYD
jgi:SAM-dependent methyltransferase